MQCENQFGPASKAGKTKLVERRQRQPLKMNDLCATLPRHRGEPAEAESVPDSFSCFSNHPTVVCDVSVPVVKFIPDWERSLKVPLYFSQLCGSEQYITMGL